MHGILNQRIAYICNIFEKNNLVVFSNLLNKMKLNVQQTNEQNYTLWTQTHNDMTYINSSWLENTTNNDFALAITYEIVALLYSWHNRCQNMNIDIWNIASNLYFHNHFGYLFTNNEEYIPFVQLYDTILSIDYSNVTVEEIYDDILNNRTEIEDANRMGIEQYLKKHEETI